MCGTLSLSLSLDFLGNEKKRKKTEIQSGQFLSFFHFYHKNQIIQKRESTLSSVSLDSNNLSLVGQKHII